MAVVSSTAATPSMTLSHFVPASLLPFSHSLLVYAIFQVGYILFCWKYLCQATSPRSFNIIPFTEHQFILKIDPFIFKMFHSPGSPSTFWPLLVSFLSFFLFLFQNVYKPKITNEKDAILFNKFGKYYKLYLFLGNLPNIIRLFYKSWNKELCFCLT